LTVLSTDFFLKCADRVPHVDHWVRGNQSLTADKFGAFTGLGRRGPLRGLANGEREDGE
jgi:hypothetical protein